MKYLKTFNNFQSIMEKSKDAYSYGCAMVYFSFPEMEEIHSMIDEEDIYTEEEDRTYGLEDEPHVTLLYGLHSKEIKDQDVMDVCSKREIVDIKLYNASLFENKDYDVLKFDADNNILFQINKDLTESFPFTTDYPDYHPHSTIAYIKKGKGKKYVEMLSGKEYIATPDKIVYSKPSGEKKSQEIGKKHED